MYWKKVSISPKVSSFKLTSAANIVCAASVWANVSSASTAFKGNETIWFWFGMTRPARKAFVAFCVVVVMLTISPSSLYLSPLKTTERPVSCVGEQCVKKLRLILEKLTPFGGCFDCIGSMYKSKGM